MGVLAFLRQLLTALSPYKGHSALILGGLLLEMGFNGCVALGFKFLIDYAIIPQDTQVLLVVLGLLAGGVVLVAIVGLGRDYLYARVCAAVLRDLRHRMFSHLQRLSMRQGRQYCYGLRRRSASRTSTSAIPVASAICTV